MGAYGRSEVNEADLAEGRDNLDEAQNHAALAARALRPVPTDMSGGKAVYPDAVMLASAHAQLSQAYAAIAAVYFEAAKL